MRRFWNEGNWGSGEKGDERPRLGGSRPLGGQA